MHILSQPPTAYHNNFITYNTDIPINTVNIPIIDPEDSKQRYTLAADNGSDIQAMGITPTIL